MLEKTRVFHSAVRYQCPKLSLSVSRKKVGRNVSSARDLRRLMASIWYPCLNLINEIQKLQFPPRSEKRLYLSPRLRYELVTGVVEILRAWAIKWAQLHFCGLSGSEDIPPQSWNIFFYEIGICINIINCPSIQLAILDQSWGKKNIWPLSQILLTYMKGKTRMPWQYKRIANSVFEGTVL